MSSADILPEPTELREGGDYYVVCVSCGDKSFCINARHMCYECLQLQKPVERPPFKRGDFVKVWDRDSQIRVINYVNVIYDKPRFHLGYGWGAFSEDSLTKPEYRKW